MDRNHGEPGGELPKRAIASQKKELFTVGPLIELEKYFIVLGGLKFFYFFQKILNLLKLKFTNNYGDLLVFYNAAQWYRVVTYREMYASVMSLAYSKLAQRCRGK